ncbi:purine-nucleoside phosphorylase [Anaeromyxobacter sp. Fw109-5]|uniref:purine-nucleoside phosphorylase n=1 Tax=Anaeromyxobacter sp. (strain Fw109-5) TaxID=404589 RepID=UPI0000ED77CC|nr:purine-nucleoside phosphorylase [Anaeromyxobacter sp. Fw109-5]ABS24876.1 inosine guanosine and xanthosine phosphorylase family [Anaeromyxobacter sp. Fw109-5]
MPHRADLSTRLSYALAWVRGKTDLAPAAGLVLGSGLGDFVDRLERAVSIPYEEIPSFPVSRVPGHVGRLVIGELVTSEGTVAVAAMQGRVHGYEGWSGEEVAFGARVLCALGVKLLLVTNAAGGVNPTYAPGDLVRIVDHLNLSGVNPLVGANDERLGPRFPDLSEAYDARLGALLEEAAARAGVTLRRGVYACMPGPSYETPAEIRMLRLLGADLVGMSTVPEVIAARHMGVPVAGLSVVTNFAAGLSRRPLSHEEVAETAGRVRDRLAAVVEGFLPGAVR